MSLSNIKISCSVSINNLEPLDPCITIEQIQHVHFVSLKYQNQLLSVH
nr:MAG TPA: hypothetical protein [Caudoviricetes sp.]